MVASSNMASLGGQEEPEPDMEHDPTLASCCQREIKDRRIKQGKLDAIRAGMPAAVCPVSPPPAFAARARRARASNAAALALPAPARNEVWRARTC